MLTARSSLGAVAVGGKIYAIGGQDTNGNDLATTEIYTPGTKSWAAGPTLLEPQGGGVAVAVSGGVIYAIGGSTDGASVEALTPGGSWSNVASLPDSRYSAAAATAGDGRIIVMGGFLGSNPFDPTNSVEAYDPASDTWTSVAPMTFGRDRLAASVGSDGRIYAIGGDIGDNPFSYRSVEAYDATTNTWTLVANMAVPRHSLGAALGPDGRIYAVGGANENVPAAATDVEAYTAPASAPAAWTAVTPLPSGRWGLAEAVTQDGAVVVAGGRSATGTVLSTTTTYSPATGTWSTTAKLPIAVTRAAAVAASDGVHIVGGFTSTAPSSAHAALLVWSGGRWVGLADLPGARELMGSTASADGHIDIVGGDAGGSKFLSSGHSYLPWGPDSWTSLAPPPTALAGATMATGNDGREYLFGGLGTGGYRRTVLVYDPSAGTWSTAAPLPDPRFAAAAVAAPDGRIYVIGGFDPVAGDTGRVDIYSPATNTWTCGPAMPAPASNLSAALLDNTIYAAGGIHNRTVLANVRAYHVGSIPADPTAPIFTRTPAVSIPHLKLGSKTVPVEIRWNATASATEIRSYSFQAQANGGPFTTEPLPWDTINDVIGTFTPGRSTNAVQVAATDCTGNQSAYSPTPTFSIHAPQETAATYRGGWKTGSSSHYYGGHTRYATARGAKATFKFTGASVAWTSELGPTHGKAYVAIDGKRVATVNLHSSSAAYRQIVFTKTFTTPGTHTLTITVAGTAGHPRVDIDAFPLIVYTTPAAQTAHAAPARSAPPLGLQANMLAHPGPAHR
jgi:N-acetylneuraminic acid mutarotase